MAKGVDDGFAQGFDGDLRHIHSLQSFQPHADMDIFKDILLGLFNQFENVAVKVVAIDTDGSC